MPQSRKVFFALDWPVPSANPKWIFGRAHRRSPARRPINLRFRSFVREPFRRSSAVPRLSWPEGTLPGRRFPGPGQSPQYLPGFGESTPRQPRPQDPKPRQGIGRPGSTSTGLPSCSAPPPDPRSLPTACLAKGRNFAPCCDAKWWRAATPEPVPAASTKGRTAQRQDPRESLPTAIATQAIHAQLQAAVPASDLIPSGARIISDRTGPIKRACGRRTGDGVAAQLG